MDSSQPVLAFASGLWPCWLLVLFSELGCFLSSTLVFSCPQWEDREGHLGSIFLEEEVVLYFVVGFRQDAAL